MIRFALTLSLVAGAAQATCPPPKDLSSQIDPLMAAIREAPNERAARQISNQLWALWATAPDDRAQDYLDTGLRMRTEYNLLGAYEQFDLLVAYCPDYAEGYNQRAFISFLRKDYPSAIADLEKALARDPDHIAALAGLALTQIGLNGPEAGQETLREALELNPWLSERRFLIEDDVQDI